MVSDFAREFSRPVRRPSEAFDRKNGAADPAERARAAHATASALLTRVRNDGDTEAVERLIAYTDTHGIDALAELWAQAPGQSLPGVLWHLHLLQRMIHDDPASSAMLYERGRSALATADPVVAGAPYAATPGELVTLIDVILRGAFEGDFALALERAAAFCRVISAGSTSVARDYEETEPVREETLTRRALRLASMAEDLSASARLWRGDKLI